MRELKHRVTVEEATFVRAIADVGPGAALTTPPASVARIWSPHRGGPIRVVEAVSARARCRECGEPLAAGESVIVFGFQPEPWNPGGHVADAYLHREPCGAGGGE